MGRLEFHGRCWFTCKIVSQRYRKVKGSVYSDLRKCTYIRKT